MFPCQTVVFALSGCRRPGGSKHGQSRVDSMWLFCLVRRLFRQTQKKIDPGGEAENEPKIPPPPTESEKKWRPQRSVGSVWRGWNVFTMIEFFCKGPEIDWKSQLYFYFYFFFFFCRKVFEWMNLCAFSWKLLCFGDVFVTVAQCLTVFSPPLYVI